MRLFNINVTNATRLNQYRKFCEMNSAVEFGPVVVELFEQPQTNDRDWQSVVFNKASLMPGVIVEQTLFDIDHPNAFDPMNIKANLRQINELIGSRATMTVVLCVLQNDEYKVFQASVEGTIVEKGVDNQCDLEPWFLPDGSKSVMSELFYADENNPRYLAYFEWLRSV